jgi:hypothetical protein
MGLVARFIHELKLYRFDYIILLIILLLTGYLRFTPIFDGGYPFLFDHGRDMLDVRKIVIDHRPTLLGPFTGLKGVFQSPLHYYLLAIPFFLSNGHPASGVFFLASLGVIGSACCYWIGRRLSGRVFGLVLSLFFAIAPTSIAWSSHFWNPFWVPFFMLFFYYFLHQGIFSNPKYLLGAAFFCSLATQVEAAFGIALFPIFIILCLAFIPNVYKNKYFWMTFPLYALTFLPQLLFDLRHDFLMTNSTINFLTGKGDSLGEFIPWDIRFGYRMNELIKATVQTLSGKALISWLFFALVVWGSLIIIVKRDIKIIKTWLLFLILPIWYFVFFMIFPRAAWSYYWIGIQVSYYFLAAFCIYILYKQYSFAKFLLIPLLLFWSVFTVLDFGGHSDVVDTNPGTYKNELRIVDTIYEDSKGKDFSVFVYTPPIYDYAYEYLFWWRGRTKYGTQPKKNKEKLFYLVIEPNETNPYAANGWVETVIKSGKTIWRKEMPGGVIVERREGSLYN